MSIHLIPVNLTDKIIEIPLDNRYTLSYSAPMMMDTNTKEIETMESKVTRIYPITFEDVTRKPWQGEFKLEVGRDTKEEIESRIHHAMMIQGYVLQSVDFTNARTAE